MKKIVTTLGLLFFFQVLWSQYWIPYLSENGLYGYMTSNGEKKTTAQFSSNQLKVLNTPTLIPNEILSDGQYFYQFSDGKIRQFYLGAEINFTPVYNITYQLKPDYNITYSQSKGILEDIHLKRKITCPNLVRYFYNDSLHIINTANGNEFSYPALVWGDDNYAFNFGKFKIVKSPGRVNFLDFQLKPIFQIDQYDGDIISSDYIRIYNDKNEQTICDNTGNILFPFTHHILYATPNKEYFIAIDKSGPPSENGECHMYIISKKLKKYELPGCSDARPLNDKYLAIRKGESWQLIDYKGNACEIPGIKYLYQFESGDFLIKNKKDKFQIIQKNGKPVNDLEFDQVNFHINRHDMVQNLICTAVIDKTLYYLPNKAPSLVRAIAPDTYSQNTGTLIPIQSKEGLVGIIDTAGHMVIPTEYDTIIFNDHIIITKKGNLHGAHSKSGKKLLDCRYEGIDARIYGDFKTADTHLLVAGIHPYKDEIDVLEFRKGHSKSRPELKTLFSIQDIRTRYQSKSKGRTLLVDPSQKQLHLMQNDSVCYSIRGHKGRSNIGTWVKSVAGPLVIFGHDNQIDSVLNRNNQSIIPSGYRCLTGLTSPVKSGNLFDCVVNSKFIPVQDKIPPPVIAKGQNNPKTQNPSIIIDVTDRIRQDQPEQAPTPEQIAPEQSPTSNERSSAYGLVDAEGKWVFPPTCFYFYWPVSPTLILQITVPENGQKYPPLQVTLHIFGQDSTWQLSISNISAVNDSTYKVTLERKKGDKDEFSAYFDRNGNQLTPFNVINSPASLTEKTLVILRKNGDDQVVCMNQNGQIIQELPDIRLVRSLEQGFQFAKNTRTGLGGVMSEAGELVIPFQFQDIEKMYYQQLYLAKDQTGKRGIYNLKNHQLIYELKNQAVKTSYINCDFNSIFQYFAFSGPNESMIIDANHRLYRSYPFRISNIVAGRFATYKDQNHQSRPVWMDVHTGKKYLE